MMIENVGYVKVKKTIIHIIPYYDSQYGGPPNVAKSLNDFLNLDKLYESKILTTAKNKKSTKTEKFFKLTTTKFWFSFDYMINSINYIKNSDFVIVHGMYTFVSFWGSFISFIFHKKVFIIPHGMFDKDSIDSNGFLKNVLRKLYLYTIGYFQVKTSKKIIFNSTKEMNNSIFNKNSMIIPNGVDLKYIENIKCDKYFFNDSKISLFYLGRINHIKGIELIIDAINDLADDIKDKLEFIVSGSGNREYVKYLKSKSNLKIIKFVGHVNDNEKYCYLKQCDIYLQPSKTEGMSISMLEALACKVNMITTNKVGLFDELKKNKAAKVIGYDKEQLKDAIIELIRENTHFKEQGYKMIKKHYDWNFIVNKYKKLIMDCK